MVAGGIIEKLHPLERKVLPVLDKHKDLHNIVKHSNLQEIEVMRALQWLENKKALKIIQDKTKVIKLDKNGIKYQKEGLPELKLLKTLTDQPMTLEEAAKRSGLDRQEINACLGLLKSKLAIDLAGGLIQLGSQASRLLKEGTPEDKFLQKKFPLNFEDIQDLEKLALDNLLKRKEFLIIEEEKKVSIELTALGKKLSKQDFKEEVVNRLTPALLKTGKWKGKNFRAYDVEINVPKIYGGRKHFVNEAVDYIKKIWLEMGFKEMTGNYTQSAFWDLDALFVPQDHPAREMQDTFYLEGKAKLPAKLYEKVKQAHEQGGNTGSRGWQYQFSKEESEQVLLRTHTTVLSAQTISKLKETDLPAKFFAVSKVFRNETLDWKHLFEFYQVEGIVIDPNANLKHLKGYLREFYQKMGYPDVRMRPAYFPYTTCSLEIEVFHPVKKQWVELGGAGIFRPEVVKP
ncbi:MAG: phenylalanine--tRNA ligase subunit alpha, partial [Candidatus Woesearchaeota archaeon]